MAKIKLDIYQLTIAALIASLKALIAKVTGNATFTSLASKIAALSSAVTALDAANTDYIGTQALLAQKLTALTAARTTAEGAARDLAAGAEAVTRDPAQLESGGFALQAARAPVGPMPAPQNASATGGDLDGTVDLQWDSIKRGVQTYLAEYATSPNGPWTQFYAGSASKGEAKGLTSGTQYWFHVCAVGAAGPGPWSDPATKRAT